MNTEMHNAIRSLGLDLSLPSGAKTAPAPAPSSAQPATRPLQQPGEAAQAQTAARAAAVEANRKLAEKGSELALEFDDALGRTIFKLVDTRTREVVRQIPSEAVLAVARALADELPSGALLKANA